MSLHQCRRESNLRIEIYTNLVKHGYQFIPSNFGYVD